MLKPLAARVGNVTSAASTPQFRRELRKIDQNRMALRAHDRRREVPQIDEKGRAKWAADTERRYYSCSASAALAAQMPRTSRDVHWRAFVRTIVQCRMISGGDQVIAAQPVFSSELAEASAKRQAGNAGVAVDAHGRRAVGLSGGIESPAAQACLDPGDATLGSMAIFLMRRERSITTPSSQTDRLATLYAAADGHETTP